MTSYLYYSSVGADEQWAEMANSRTEEAGKLEQLTLKSGSQIETEEMGPPQV